MPSCAPYTSLWDHFGLDFNVTDKCFIVSFALVTELPSFSYVSKNNIDGLKSIEQSSESFAFIKESNFFLFSRPSDAIVIEMCCALIVNDAAFSSSKMIRVLLQSYLLMCTVVSRIAQA